MAKLTLVDPTTDYESIIQIAANNALIETAMENTLSLDGTANNQMMHNIIMGGYSVMNYGSISYARRQILRATLVPRTTSVTVAVFADLIIPEGMDGFIASRVTATTTTAGTGTNQMDIRFYKFTPSTGTEREFTDYRLEIDSGENTSRTSDDWYEWDSLSRRTVQTGDVIRIKIGEIHNAVAAKGCQVAISYEPPPEALPLPERV